MEFGLLENLMENKKIKNKPIWIGTGLVALDVIIDEINNEPQQFLSGGSCGNVSSIISFLGFKSYPIARLKSNVAAKKVVEDLDKWNVKTSLITVTKDGSTPIIIQRIKKNKAGFPVHKFEFRDPETGDWLPSYKPVLSANVSDIVKKVDIPSVFYFDRINRGSIDFAKFYKANGSLVYFEPNSISDERLFEECLEVADIIKFSNERMGNYQSIYPRQRVPLEIQTFGENGVAFRFSHQLNEKKWNKLPGLRISKLVDASGAGDWMSAGLIFSLGSNGSKGFKKISQKQLLSSLRYGQALGSLNCFFNGARGLMYQYTKQKCDLMVKQLLDLEDSFVPTPNKKVKSQGNKIAIRKLL